MLPPPPDAAAAAAMAATEAEEELALFLLKTDFLYERGLSPPPPLDFSFSSTMLHEPRGDANPPPGLRGLNGVEECIRYGLEQLPDSSHADIKVEMFRGDDRDNDPQIYSHGVHLDDLLG